VGKQAGRAHRWAGIVGIAGLVLTAVFAGQTGPAGGQEPHGHEPNGILPEGDWTEQQVMEAVHMVENTTAALPRFADQSTLEALGFVNFRDPAPGGWTHWINRDWWDDEHTLDPNFPESLVFRHTDQGDVLEAAMFFLPPEYTMSTIPENLRWWPGWHTHEGELCEDADELYFTGLAFDGGCSEGSQVFVSGPMMHVWIADNPCGHRFAGIGIGGIECGPHDPHDPDPHEPDPHEPGPHDPEPPGPGPSGPSTTAPTGRGTAPPARPVRGNPNFVG
jgi:hypothetical protein